VVETLRPLRSSLRSFTTIVNEDRRSPTNQAGCDGIISSGEMRPS
jgi:hypothetical protein